MNAPVTEAIILAGGRGERLRPLTDHCPKPMVMVAGMPLMHHTINWLKESGIKRVIVSCGYLHNVISDYFKDGSELGIEIAYAVEDEPLGRGGGIKLASRCLNSGLPVLVINGDVVTDLRLGEVLNQHTSSDKPVTMVTTPLRCSYGIVDIDERNGLATGFCEKPILPYWVNAGIYVFDGDLFGLFPAVGDHESNLLPELSKQGLIKTHRFHGFWKAVDSRKDLDELNREHKRYQNGQYLSATPAPTRLVPIAISEESKVLAWH